MPSLFVVVSIEAPDGVVSNTVAPTSAAPDGSVTWPRIAPVWFCGRHGNAISNMIRRSKTPLRPDFCAAFIRITEKLRPSAISIVALALLRRVSSAIAQAPRSQILDACSRVVACSRGSTPPKTVMAVTWASFGPLVATIITTSPF